MRDLLTIIIVEKNTLLRGLTVSFLLILPFTFIPNILKYGLTIETIARRFNHSVLYSLGFALIAVIVAILQNYNGLVHRKWYFDQPAFKSLDFYGRVNGVGSILHDLETILLGEIGEYLFRLNLIDTDKKKPKVEIVPLIELNAKEEQIRTLVKDYGFRKELFFGKTIPLNEIDLESNHSIKTILLNLADILKKLEFKPLDLGDEFKSNYDR